MLFPGEIYFPGNIFSPGKARFTSEDRVSEVREVAQQSFEKARMKDGWFIIVIGEGGVGEIAEGFVLASAPIKR